jgi:hypothetical protein
VGIGIEVADGVIFHPVVAALVALEVEVLVVEVPVEIGNSL